MKERIRVSRSSNGAHTPVLKRTALAAAVTAALTAFGAPGMVQAQDTSGAAAAPFRLDEIVVTAQRREQNLQDVPISVQAFTQEKMDVQGIRDMSDIAQFTPSLTFNSTTGLRSMNSSISIRGVSSSVGGATTGIYINDTPIAIRTLRSSGGANTTAYPHLFDIQRVAVLRGPQGTLFGSGSEGGTVRFITPEPSLSGSSVYMRSGASATKGGAPSYEFGVAGGTPIIENTLGFRGSLSTSRTGGYVDHGDFYTGLVDEPNYNHKETWSMRLALKYAATDRLTISPSYFHQQIKNAGSGGFYLPDNLAGVTGVGTPGSYYEQHHLGVNGLPLAADGSNSWPNGNNYGHFGAGISSGNYVNAVQVIPKADQFMNLYDVKFEYALPKINMTYDVSIYKNSQHSVSDFSFLPFGLFTSIFGNYTYFPSNPSVKAPEYDDQANRAFTQELRVQNANPDGMFQWVVGAYVQQQDMFIHSFVDTPNWPLIFEDIPSTFFGPNNCNSYTSCAAVAFPVLNAFFGPAAGLYQGRYAIALNTWANNDQKAVFGNVDINATDHLTVTLGTRYAKMHYDTLLESYGLVDGIPANGSTGNVQSSAAESDATTPRFGLKWTTDGGKMFYMTAAKGTRNGGTNQTFSPSNSACRTALEDNWGMSNVPESYDPDSVWSYELGSKFRALDDKLTVNADVFQIKWKDIIRNVSVDPNGSSCVLSFTTNLGDAHSQGAELDVQYYPIDNLMLSASAGYAKVQSDTTLYVPDPSNDGTNPNQPMTGVAYTQNANGDWVPKVMTREGAILSGSHTTFSLAAQYSFTAFQNPSYVRLDYHTTMSPTKGDAWDPASAQYAGANDLFETPDVRIANLRVGTNLNDWDVSLFVKNLTNSQPIFKFRQQSGTAWMSGSTIRPREIGFTAVLRY